MCKPLREKVLFRVPHHCLSNLLQKILYNVAAWACGCQGSGAVISIMAQETQLTANIIAQGAPATCQVVSCGCEFTPKQLSQIHQAWHHLQGNCDLCWRIPGTEDHQEGWKEAGERVGRWIEKVAKPLGLASWPVACVAPSLVPRDASPEES